jgi:hypothetical protein
MTFTETLLVFFLIAKVENGIGKFAEQMNSKRQITGFKI